MDSGGWRMWQLASFLMVGMILFTGCKGTISANPSAESGATSVGHQLFLSHCVSCHMGTTDSSGPNAVIVHSATLQSEAAFKELLRHPTSATMPAFDEKSLDEQAVHELYTYLTTVKTE
jgi:mono/diheme cytochrome c family protein